MAAAEARTAWQRAANRYFVQEDAKRAPRLAYCPSSALLSKQTDTGPPNSGSDPDHRSAGFMPSNRTSYSNLPPDAKWWLQMEPNYGLHRGLNLEQSKPTTTTETSAPLTSITDSSVTEIAPMCKENIYGVDCEDLESFVDVKKSSESQMEEISVVDGKIDQDFLDIKNMKDYYEFLGMDTEGGSVCHQTSEFSSAADSLIGEEKVPWWHVTDKEELASFVAQKSLNHIENCDLPPPQKMCVRKEQYKPGSLVNHDESLLSSVDSLDRISLPSGESSIRKRWSSLKEGPLHVEDAGAEPLRSNSSGAPEKGRTPISDPCRAKLLEALCHSQTRAREAETAAKQAYTEKEHLLKLFFRQASHLFAYKQWFKLLQLETLLLQSTKGDSSPLTAFPDSLPWMPQKPRKLPKNWQKPTKAKRRKRSSEENDIGKYCVAFAVGFTLVGAGLILGWTVGWLFPAF